MDWDPGYSVADVADMMYRDCPRRDCDIYRHEVDDYDVLACHNCDRIADPLG